MKTLLPAILLALTTGSRAYAGDAVDAGTPVPDVAVEEQPAQETRPDLPKTKTLPETWSGHGWEDLRWGMGTGDVAEALKGRYSYDTVLPPSREDKDQFYYVVLTEPIFGFKVRASFEFTNDRLNGVSLFPLSQEGSLRPSVDERSRWRASVKSVLEAKYGTPSQVNEDGGYYAHWERQEGRISVYSSDTSSVETVRYDAPPPKLAKTSPKTWSKHGWQNLHWGMGPGDVEVALQGRFSSAYSLPSLHKDRDPSQHVVLTEPIFGFRVKANLYFQGGWLNQLSLEPLPQDGSDKLSAGERVLWLATLKPALEAKYGKPSQVFDQGDDDTAHWERREGRISLITSDKSHMAHVTYFSPVTAEQRRKWEKEKQRRKQDYAREVGKL